MTREAEARRASGGMMLDTIGAMIDRQYGLQGWCLRCRSGFGIDMATLARRLGRDHSLARRTELLQALPCPTCRQWSQVSISTWYAGGKMLNIPDMGRRPDTSDIPVPARPRRVKRAYDQ